MGRLEKMGFQRPKKKQLNEYRKPDVQIEPKIVPFQVLICQAVGSRQIPPEFQVLIRPDFSVQKKKRYRSFENIY
jgi:hypothetical protein